MHVSAMINAKAFFDVYSQSLNSREFVRVLDVGSQDVNGSLRSAMSSSYSYTGVDFLAGKGVDIVIKDPYKLPFETGTFDVVISSSCFEHAEMFWLVFLEILRVLKDDGLFYLNAPSNGRVHRFPVDCWRFYPDAGNALVKWARRNDLASICLESYVSAQSHDDNWNDFVAVFLKDEKHKNLFARRILDNKLDVENAQVFGKEQAIRQTELTEDMRKQTAISQIILNQTRVF